MSAQDLGQVLSVSNATRALEILGHAAADQWPVWLFAAIAIVGLELTTEGSITGGGSSIFHMLLVFFLIWVLWVISSGLGA